MAQVLFVSGIDTDAGKSYATGMLALRYMEQGLRVVTQKFVQTGCPDGYSDDIALHRRLMGVGLLDVDLDHTTAPVVFSYPASAQLAAAMDGREIDLSLVEKSTATLSDVYDVVLIEGAGGLMVPITDDYLTIDYIERHSLPVVLVTNARLGSINHTILSLEAIASRGITLHSVVFNHYFDSDKPIAEDTRGFIERYVRKHFPDAEITDLYASNL